MRESTNTFYIADSAGFLQKHKYDTKLFQDFIWKATGNAATIEKSPRGNKVVCFKGTWQDQQLLEKALVRQYRCLWIYILEKDF